MRIKPTPVILALMISTSVQGEQVALEKLQAIAAAARPALVRVEYRLQYAGGEGPQLTGWSYRCPNCGSYHGFDAEDDINQDRPLQAAGFVISPTEVITTDPIVHPRFIRSISVCFNSAAVPARITSYGLQESGILLTLEKPLDGVKPLAFDKSAASPFFALQYTFTDGAWTVTLEPASGKLSDRGDGRCFCPVSSGSLLMSAGGASVGLTMSGELDVGGSWKGSPRTWTWVDEAAMSQELAALKEATDVGLPRVSLTFRSPKNDPGQESQWRYRFSSEENNATQREVPGVLVNPQTVLVLAELRPDVTARLERILVHPASGEPVVARFLCTLKDHGALLAELDREIKPALRLEKHDAEKMRRALMLAADIRIQGDNRTAFFQHMRIASLQRGWKGRLQPQLTGSASNIFLFDREGRLLALPLAARRKVELSESYHSWRDAGLMTVSAIHDVLHSPKEFSDPNNVPLDEREEQRLAWLGVQLQPLTKDLARANGVAHLTQDGQTGALVTYVYPDSPAARASVEPGYILLRLHVPGEPKPIDIQMQDAYSSFGQEFPWENLNDLPLEYFSQLPRPWPPARNLLTQALTELGFGRPFAAEFFHKGETLRRDFEVVRGPDHFDSAPRWKSELLGMTVSDLTFEVRQYFHKESDAPGVIIAKVETGGKAGVSRLRPYEIITHVNDSPVSSAAAFKAAASAGELRLAVEGKTRKRVVRLRVPASRPATMESPAPGSQVAGE